MLANRKLETKEKILIITLIIIGLATYFAGLFADITRDAAKYGYISKMLSQGGDFIRISIDGEPYNQKPQLMFWLSAVSMRLFSSSNFAFKLPILLYSLIGVYATFRLGKSMYDVATGRLAALMLFFSFGMFVYNIDVHTDTVLFTNVALSLWWLYEYLKTSKWLYFIAGFVAIGLSILTKGPFGAVIPFFAVLAYLISTNNYKRLFSPIWLVGVAIALLIALPALLNFYQNFGWDGIRFFIIDNNLGRIKGGTVGLNNDFTFYIHTLAFLFFPWSFLVFIGIYFDVQLLHQKKSSPTDLFLMGGIWIIFIILSISKNKLPNYILSLFPLFSILAAKWVIKIYQNSQSSIIQKAISVCFYIQAVAIWLIAIVFTTYIFPSQSVYFQLFMVAMFLTSGIIFMKFDKIYRSFYLLIISILVLCTNFNFKIFPEVLSLQAQPQAAEIINKKATSTDKIYEFDAYIKNLDSIKTGTNVNSLLNYELKFYVNQYVNPIFSEESLKLAIKTAGAWIYTSKEGLAEIKKFNPEIDTTYTLVHFNLRRPGKYLIPSKRQQALEVKYVVKISAEKFIGKQIVE